ncbi:nucleolin 1-like [Macadamia integrifolia]|uniref:nucleolin 1-like n=1 Tax=Macadamia integrifolia TaxID=60698 RepID=UPI001C4E59C5|nr:nucleolin 1-like [Macadamia integrifolia]
MGKKSAQQVAKAVSVTPPAKSGKKGKRNAGETLEKMVSAKKQKIAEVQLLKKQNKVVKTIKKKEPSSSEDHSASESEEETEAKVTKLPAAKSKNGHAVISKEKDESSDGSDSDNNSDEDDPTEAPKEIDGSEDGSSGEESEEEEPAMTPKKKQSTKESSCSEDSLSEEESEEEQPAKTPKNKHMTPATTNVQTPGAVKTLFAGNLSFKIERNDVEEFFKDAGVIVDVRFSTNKEGRFSGFGHVEFSTEEEAKKALELNGQDLLGRPVKLDIARERGSSTPHSSKESNSYQKGGKGQARTIFVRGFDASTGEDQIRSALEEHFESCGEISRVSIPKDYETGGPKGIAYIDFPNEDSFSKALELDGCELGGNSLVVEEAKPRTDSRDGGGSGRRGGGRRGGRDGGGRRGGRDSDGRFGGRRGGGRSGGRGHSGRGARGR